MAPGLEERLTQQGELEIAADYVSPILPTYQCPTVDTSSQLRRGLAAARGDDTKGLKGIIIDWITPKGQILDPPLSRNSKVNRGFHHDATGALLCPTWMDWNDPQ